MRSAERFRRVHSVALACAAFATISCGSKTGLRVPRIDASTDTPSDVPPDAPTMPSYLGTEFWAVSTSNAFLARNYPFHFAVALGNPGDSIVDVTITGGELTAPRTSRIAPHQTITVQLPWVEQLSMRTNTNLQCSGVVETMPEIASTQRANGAYRIVSSAPINAYQFNPLEFTVGTSGCTAHSYTNDASLLLPTQAIGNDYLVLAYDGTGPTFVAIAGTQEEPTTVTIVPRANIAGSTLVPDSPAGQMRTFTLARGEVVQLVSSILDPDRYDLTGSEIHASAPIAVFSGNNCTNVSGDNNLTAACDHLEEQLFPEDTWGNEVVVTQLQDRTPTERYMVRILSASDGNRLTFTPETDVHPPATLARGEALEFESAADFTVHGTGSILVAQFMEGQDTTTPQADVGDPAMVLEVPERQYRRDYSFVIPATYTSNFVQVTAHADAMILLDGRPFAPPRAPITGSPWTVLRQRITPGSHTLVTTDPAGIGLKVVGVAQYTSYMYPGGLDLSRE